MTADVFFFFSCCSRGRRSLFLQAAAPGGRMVMNWGRMVVAFGNAGAVGVLLQLLLLLVLLLLLGWRRWWWRWQRWCDSWWCCCSCSPLFSLLPFTTVLLLLPLQKNPPVVSTLLGPFLPLLLSHSPLFCSKNFPPPLVFQPSLSFSKKKLPLLSPLPLPSPFLSGPLLFIGGKGAGPFC